MSTATVPLADLFDPVAGTLPSGIVSSDVVSDTATSYTNTATYPWTLGTTNFTVQGQKWETNRRLQLLSGYAGLGLYPVNYGGARQVSTPRFYTAPTSHVLNEHAAHTTDFEFLFVGQAFTLSHYNLGGNGSYKAGSWAYGGDTQIWVEYGGRMWRIADNPKTTLKTSDGPSSRNVTFDEPYVGRIRVTLSNANFNAIITEQSSIVAPAPARPFLILDGDSYTESSQTLDADSTSGWFSAGIAAAIFERTGFAIAQRGQGSTGPMTNGAGIATDDTLGSQTLSVPIFGDVTIGGSSRFGSASRLGWMSNAAALTVLDKINIYTGQVQRPGFVVDGGEDFGQPVGRRPVAYVCNGSWNCAAAGGVSDAVMYARAKDIYRGIHNLDPLCRVVHISPEPFDDALFNGGEVGPPRTGDKSDIHRVAQARAASESPRVTYVNAFGPDSLTRWWVGSGPAPASSESSPLPGSPTDSQQAQLVSVHDGIHYRKEGGVYYGNKIADAIADTQIPAARAYGLA